MAKRLSESQPSASLPSQQKYPALWPVLWLTALGLFLLSRDFHLAEDKPRPYPVRPRPESQNPAYLIRAHYGAVASENERCSDIGVAALKDGGNAVDAAISATLCIGVVNMFSSGIGGGGFATVRIPPILTNGTSSVYTIDFREVGPALANATMYVKHPILARFGGLSVGVPGELRGLEEMHKRWGILSWKRLVQPSVDLAAGWRVDRELGRRIPWYASLMLDNPDFRAIFAPNGVFLKEGEMIRRTNLSKTLSDIAEDGAGAFYRGRIAESIVRKVRDTGGVFTLQDLADYKVIVSRALEGTFLGRKVYTTHTPTSGPVLLHMLNLAEKLEMDTRDEVNTHRIVELLKFGFAARTRIGDPLFHNDTHIMDRIHLKSYAEGILPNVTDDRTHPPEYYNPVFDIKIDHGTSHISAVDKNGMAVAITSTVNAVFGSQVLDSETGVLLNNEMDDFSTPGVPNGFGLWPSPYNYPGAGKRPLSSIAPTIIEHKDGTFHLAIGGSGGSRIFGALFQVIMNLRWGLDASAAIEYGRIHDQLYPSIVDVDDTYPKHLTDGLRQRGHNVLVADINRVAAAVHLVVTDQEGRLFAASDSRKNGIAAGY